MELITNWEIFDAVSLAFRQFQGLLGIMATTGVAIFKYDLGEKLEIFKQKGGEASKNR